METIIVSACLLGENTKYNGGNNYNKKIEEIKKKFDIIPVCPECLGGLKTPRLASEIKGDFVFDSKGKDVTNNFNEGAIKVKNAAIYMRVKKAILMDRSPSCGVHEVYNGYFVNKLTSGEGITTKLLKKHGIECYTIDEFYDLFINENKEDQQ